jgi:hypothetical protein
MRAIRIRSLLSVAAALILCAGCEYDKYVIDMRPEGDSCRRTIVCWRADDDARPPKVGPISQGRADEISKCYPAGKDLPDLEKGKRGFAGAFTGVLPQDVGGAGSYTRFRSEMGELFLYVERFRGNPDQARVLARAAYCADQLAEMLALWFASEMKEEPRLPQLLDFIRGPLRQDMHNVSLYSWMPQFARNSQRLTGERPEQFAVQAAQFLVERGYFRIEDVPVLVASISVQGERETAQMLRLVQRLAATRMGVPADKPLPASLAFLADGKRVAASFDRFRKTEGFARWLAGIDPKRVTGDPEAKTWNADPDDPAGPLLQRMVCVDLWFGQDKVEVTLHSGERPFSTNGTWEEPTRSVGWAAQLPPQDGLPLLCYAFWSAPDDALQKKRFGKRILENEKLAEYVLWRATLTPQEGREWGEFLATLAPGPELAAKLRAWRFASEKATPAPERDAANKAKGLILEALEAR